MLGCAQLGHFIKVKLYKLEGNKSLVKGYIGKLLIRIDGVGAPTRYHIESGSLLHQKPHLLSYLCVSLANPL